MCYELQLKVCVCQKTQKLKVSVSKASFKEEKFAIDSTLCQMSHKSSAT